MYAIGIDIGGTFVDSVLIDRSTGEECYAKADTRLSDLGGSVINSLTNLATAKGVSFEEMLSNTFSIGHGTTTGTNAVATKQGVRVGLIATKGFEDTVYMQRATGRFAGLEELERLHQVVLRQPPPLVAHELIKCVTERIDCFGNVVIPIDENEVRKVVGDLLNNKPDAIAICLLSSYLNGKHEQIIKKIIQEFDPQIPISVSSEIMPKIRENGRFNTAIINAYIDPIVKPYIGKLNAALKEKGCRADMRIMNASGGTTSIPLLHSILTVGSGPAAGVIGAKYLGGLYGYKDIITIDGGGTTFDVSVIANGQEQMAEEYFGSKGVIDRYETVVPRVDIKSIGAGGGTIIRFDDVTKTIKIGPRSAGAIPGPVFYDRGGVEPTLGDAYMVLGYLNPDFFLGGTMKTNKEKAVGAIKEKLAEPMKMSVTEIVAGAFELTNSLMTDAMRSRVVMKGFYPHDFVLFSFGGSGSMHSAFLGRNLEVKKLINLSRAAFFSAFGVGISDTLHKYSISRTLIEPYDIHVIDEAFTSMVKDAQVDAEKEGRKLENTKYFFSLDMKYGGQVHELVVPVERKKWTEKNINEVKDLFMKLYEEKYGAGSAYKAGGVQIVALNLDCVATWDKPILKVGQKKGTDPSGAFKGYRSAYFGKYKDYVKTGVYDGLKLQNGNVIEGPAIIERPETTMVIPPDLVSHVDGHKNVIIEY